MAAYLLSTGRVHVHTVTRCIQYATTDFLRHAIDELIEVRRQAKVNGDMALDLTAKLCQFALSLRHYRTRCALCSTQQYIRLLHSTE